MTTAETKPRASADGDLMKLYSQRILALAASIPHARRLEAPGGTAMKRSPLCGSTVTVDLSLDDGRVAAFGQDVKACALGQASAAVLGRSVIGLSRAEIEAGREALRQLIKEDGPEPAVPFADLEALRPARDYRNRHASILLAWDATLAAIDAADEAAG
ncbi:iron-sulfur cluster assembly scaffold protein [Paralimibaculum aggregatum]|uniref:Iron-sulfur cluster assembly scaffold protein n=1 Tax=Paralimibaculum aggregatum TaxID=3036245 RepID=A0ABQ6LDK7_9RHOB|nr:iron-sulfur cluster assembly scaffold protein [Limibaculum sp. NKW23]GMG81437.1 iron-sulfur cluster assembly scaffold protein [Limibaculum sp. NKW23]